MLKEVRIKMKEDIERVFDNVNYLDEFENDIYRAYVKFTCGEGMFLAEMSKLSTKPTYYKYEKEFEIL